jgi:hypothetical protein
MTELRVSERSHQDKGEAGDTSSDAPMGVAMEMVTAVTPIPAESAGATIIEPMERNEQGKQRWWSKRGQRGWRKERRNGTRTTRMTYCGAEASQIWSQVWWPQQRGARERKANQTPMAPVRRPQCTHK